MIENLKSQRLRKVSLGRERFIQLKMLQSVDWGGKRPKLGLTYFWGGEQLEMANTVQWWRSGTAVIGS